MILFYVPCGSKKEAEKIIFALLRKNLIACGNIFASSSIYFWERKIKKTKEYVAIMKAKNKSKKRIEKEIKKLHSYKIPCILKINVNANKEFLGWIK